MKRILLVEDYEEKANNILAFLKQEFPECEVIQRSSYNSAQEEIFEHGSDYSLILLDMSMSTYDLSKEHTFENILTCRWFWQATACIF